MSHAIQFEDLQGRIIELRGKMVLLDADVAELYGVETKRINEAVKNNPEKFPAEYIIELDKNEWESLKSKYSTSMKGGKVKLPSAFSEKGLYRDLDVYRLAHALGVLVPGSSFNIEPSAKHQAPSTPFLAPR
jgi:hypothetical protein